MTAEHASGLHGAVFLSYASEDAEAAARIAAGLRAAGIEVWFDRSELRGGDAWDAMIRRQIKACALFIPVISSNAHARGEGYFRLEWKLAIDRSHLMASNLPFLLPVAIDDTTQADERIPDRFRDLQWTRLPGGRPAAAFVERVQGLLAADEPAASGESRGVRPSAPMPRSAPAPGVPGSVPPLESAGRATRVRGVPRIAVLGVAAAVVLGLGYLALGRLASWRHAATAASTAVIANANPSGVPAASIAVLPLVNESGDAGQQYFSDGISEDLITALSQVPELRVVGRASSFRFRDSKEDSRTIGTQLGVAHLLAGSVRRAGDVVRVSAELINAADGTTQWSDRYDRPYKDLFALQDEITRAVAGALKTRLLAAGSGKAQSDRPPSGNLEAYTALLQGRFYSGHHNEAGYRRAIDELRTATQLDPRYAQAWSELARTLDALAENYQGGAVAQQTYAKAQAAAERALTLAPDLAAAHVAQGYLLQRAGFDPRAARAEFERAVQLAPEDLEAKFALGNQLASFGQVARAVELTRQVLDADPMNSRRLNWQAIYLSALGRLDEAERAANKAMELSPDSDSFAATQAAIAVLRGDARTAISIAERSPPGSWRNIALAWAYQIGPDRAAADAALKRLVDTASEESAFQIAEVYALRKDADKTFEWLEHAWTTRDPGLTGVVYDPFIARYRADPRFAAYCRKVGLPAPGEAVERT